MAATAANQDRHTRWNFIVIVLDASFFGAGLAFLDPVAVLPVLIEKLSGSEVVVGLMSALQRAGWIVPQLLGASIVLHRPRKKPFVVYPCLLGRLPFLALAIFLCMPGARAHLQAVLLLLIAAFTTFFFADGLIGVPWHDIIARTIPSGLRGRFFGSIQFLGGLLAMGSGWVVHRVLADPTIPFPQNYGRLFVLLFICMAISTFFLALIREPRSSAVAERHSLSRIIRAIPSTFRRSPLLLRVIVVQNICGIAGLALPFYAVYANVRLFLPAHTGGIFIWAAIVGSVLASIVWAYLNDRHGCVWVIRAVACLVVGVPLTALVVPPLVRALGVESAMAYIYAVVFLLNGATWGGMWMGFTNYVLELAPDDVRPLFLGLNATLAAPTILMPVLGGALLGVMSYEVLFTLVVVAGVAAVIYSHRLPTPRALPPATPGADPDLGTPGPELRP